MGIRVNTICPGLVMTPFVAGSEDFIDALGSQTPMVRGAEPEEIASVLLFLVSDDSSYITGHDIAVDGGFTDFGGYNAVLQQIMAQPSQKI